MSRLPLRKGMISDCKNIVAISVLSSIGEKKSWCLNELTGGYFVTSGRVSLRQQQTRRETKVNPLTCSHPSSFISRLV